MRVHSASLHTQPGSVTSSSLFADGRWYITNLSRDWRPDLRERVSRANTATGKSVVIHDQPIPDGRVMGSPNYKAEWASDCQSLSIDGGYQDMSEWWRVFDGRPATTAPSDTQPGTQPGLPGEVKQSNQEQSE